MSRYPVNPVYSIAGVMPASPEMTHWKTAYPNPDAVHDDGHRRSVGPCLSIAGVMPGTPEMTNWKPTLKKVVDEDALFAQQLENVRRFGLGHLRRPELERTAEVRELRPATKTTRQVKRAA